MKFSKAKEMLLLFAVLLISAVLRFYKLGEIPNGLYVDEATTGYNAYSILLTGKDEYGEEYPVAFRFFGSYSPPLYTYLTTLAVASMGLNAFSVRFISALSGILGTLLVYLFIRAGPKKLRRFAAVGSFLFAISPWSIFFSRAGYELNLGFTILIFGILFLWKGLTNPKFVVLAFTAFSLSTYGAHPERFLVPILVLGTLLFFRRLILSKKFRSYTFLGLFLGAVVQTPNFYLFTTPAFSTKYSLFYRDLIAEQAEKISRFLPLVFTYPLAFIREFTSKYLAYFSPRNLFLLEDPDIQRAVPGLAPFFVWMAVPYCVGLFILWKNRKTLFSKYLIFLLLVFPIPLALTSDPFSSQRGLYLLFPLIIIISLGTDYLISRWKRYGIFVFLLFCLISPIFIWRSYFILLPFERAKVWGYGFERLAKEIEIRPGERFVIDQTRMKPAYAALVFFLKYPPEKLQESVDERIRENYYSNVVFNQNYKFANLETRNIRWEEDIYKKQILVGDEFSVSPNQAKEHFLTKVFEIRDPTGEIVFMGYKTNPGRKCAETNSLSVYCKKTE